MLAGANTPGVVPGSFVLVGGDPGIGKSTLMLQLAAMVADPSLDFDKAAETAAMRDVWDEGQGEDAGEGDTLAAWAHRKAREGGASGSQHGRQSKREEGEQGGKDGDEEEGEQVGVEEGAEQDTMLRRVLYVSGEEKRMSVSAALHELG